MRSIFDFIKCLSIDKLIAIFPPQAKIRLKPCNNGGLLILSGASVCFFVIVQ